MVAETGWEPVAHEAQRKGHDVDYAYTVEGYDKWSQNLMVPSQVKDRNGLDQVYTTVNWLLGGAYAAELSTTTGYVTPRLDLGLEYAREHGWPAARIDMIQAVIDKGRRKFAKDLYWDPGYYRNLERFELEIARFRNAESGREPRMIVDDPAILAEVSAEFASYETALMENDIAVLDGCSGTRR